MDFVLSFEARTDLLDIDTYIAEKNPEAASRLVDEFFEAFAKLARRPELGHVRRDLTTLPVRFWPLRSFLIIYDPGARPLMIVRVLSGYRDIVDLLG